MDHLLPNLYQAERNRIHLTCKSPMEKADTQDSYLVEGLYFSLLRAHLLPVTI